MNIKKSLSAVILMTMFFVGCSGYQVEEKKTSLPDEATKQKTMTKVQNNISEIMDKDYEYVLSNLGEPNATSYWIEKDKVNDLQTIEDIETLKDINLVYLKDVTDEDTNSSALYLQFENDKVKKAQIVDYSSPGINKSLIKSKILVDCYTDGDIVSLNTLNQKNLDDFIGANSSEVENIVENKKVTYDVYLFDKTNKSINVYRLDDNNKLLAIFTENNKISEIKILSNTNEVVNTIKHMMLDN